jgi:MFS family permease
VSASQQQKAGWSELFTGANAAYTVMVMLGVVMYSLQILIIVTVMPTVVSEIGGGAYYVWASMLYQVGAIVGAASVGPVWSRTGGRGAFVLAGAVFALGTLGCAVAPGMLELVLSRGVQGYGGGLIIGGTMGLVGRVFQANQRTRVLAVYQGMWSLCSLVGPFFGGAFAEIGWWRGAFWTSLPFIVGFCAMAWWKVPKGLSQSKSGAFPVVRIGMLALGVMGVAGAGQMPSAVGRAVLIVLAIACIALTFRVDARAKHKLFPSDPLSLTKPVGMGYWMLIIVGAAQAGITILLPLVLQVVHEVTPLLVGVSSLLSATAWTIGTFLVSGWAGSRERFAMVSGPLLMVVAVLAFLAAIQGGSLAVLLSAAFVLGFGVGVHHVHLNARIMENAVKGEETITASSMSMVRSLGQAIGTASAGMVANIAGLGVSIDPGTVAHSVSTVFVCALVPLGFAVVLIARLAHRVVPAGEPAGTVAKAAAKT